MTLQRRINASHVINVKTFLKSRYDRWFSTFYFESIHGK
jgi:hypothetical protein